MLSRLRVATAYLGELFDGGSAFTVPAFQRPYDWGAEEALQLLDDVSRAAGIDAPELAEPDYFLGTLLLLADEDVVLPGTNGSVAGERQEYAIIDGQQRLTTLTMIFAALRDLAAETDSITSRLAELVMVPASSVQRRGDKLAAMYRLSLSGVDSPHFLRYVQRPGGMLDKLDDDAEDGTRGRGRILEVRDALMATLTQLSREQRDTLASFLLDRCQVVITMSSGIDRAHRLFTVLNERGKPLRRNDILKVEVLGGLAPSESGYAARMWEATERLLGPDFESFFSHLKQVHGRSSKTVVTGLRSLIAESSSARDFIDDVLLPYAKIFAHIQSCRVAPAADAAPLARHLYYLNRLRSEDWIPAAMLALQKYRDRPDTALALVRGIDRATHVTRILCQGGGKRTSRFNHIIKAIRSGAAVDDTASVFQLSRDELRSTKFYLKNLYRRNQPVCRLLLLRINDHLSGTLVNVDPSDLSVEHVIPTKPGPNSNWRVLYKEPDVREAATESLGNLTLLPEKLNDRMRNYDFEEKRTLIVEHYETQPMLKIVRDVVEAENWDLATVASREMRFLEALSLIIGVDVRDAAMERPGGSRDVA